MTDWLVLIIVLLAGAAALHYTGKARGKRDKLLTSKLNGVLKTSLMGFSFKGEQGGFPIVLNYAEGNHGRFLTVKVVWQADFRMNVYKKIFGILVLRKFDLEGESAYENMVVSVAGRYEDSARAFLQKKAVKENLKFIIKNAVDRLKVTEKYITATYPVLFSEEEAQAGKVAELVERMCAMAR